MGRLDTTDLNLLTALQEDARATNRSLARRVQLSDSACAARLKRLEREGFIIGYEVALSFERLGAFETWVDVTLVNDHAQTLSAFESLLPEEREIRAAYLIGDEVRFRLHVVTASFEHWCAFSARMLAHRAVVKGLARAVIYKSYRTKSCAIEQAIRPRPDDRNE